MGQKFFAKVLELFFPTDSEGVRESQRGSLVYTCHLAPRRGAAIPPASTGGLRFATTTGYFLATLRVASLRFKLDCAKMRR